MPVAQSFVGPNLTLVHSGVSTPSMAITRTRGVAFATDGYTAGADGTPLHYYTVGEGSPAIVCCDGIGCDGYAWKYVASDFAARHRVVRWHYRGHGLSGKPSPDRMTIADLVDDLIRVMDAQNIERAVLLGHSLGVQVILDAHRRHPERVLALVPMCGSFGRPLDTFKDSTILRRLLPTISMLFTRFPRAAQALWKQFDTELAYQISMVMEVNRNLARRADFRSYFTHMSKMDPQLFIRLLEDASTNDALPHLSKIDVPTLIVAGERDGFTPRWLSAIMQSRIPGSELCTVPMGTHTAPIEMPELVNLRLRRFLDERVLPVLSQPARVEENCADVGVSAA
jgi:pimeloyl-ACP methyl ester carboxylesterase